MAYTEFAKLYDELITDCPYGQWVEFITRHAPNARSVADGACGTGNVTLGLVKHFGDVTAFDLSEEMLDVAREKLRKSGKSIPLLCGDLVDFSLLHKVDLFTICCDGINYLTEDGEALQCFENVYRSLNDGGVLIFDISTEYKLRNMDGQMYGSDDENVSYIWQNTVEDNKIEMALSFFVKQVSGDYYRVDECQCQRIYSECEIENILKKTGFISVEKYDSYTESAPSDKTQRITYCALKRR